MGVEKSMLLCYHNKFLRETLANLIKQLGHILSVTNYKWTSSMLVFIVVLYSRNEKFLV